MPRHCRCPERTPRLVRAETCCEQLRMRKLAVCARVARGGNRFGIFAAMRRLRCAHGASCLEISGVHDIGINRSRMFSCPPLLTECPLGLLAVYAQTALHSVSRPGSMELALCPGRQGGQMALECRAPCRRKGWRWRQDASPGALIFLVPGSFRPRQSRASSRSQSKWDGCSGGGRQCRAVRCGFF